MDQRQARRIAEALGLGSLALGVPLALAPRLSARLAGLSVGPEPGAEFGLRAVGVRDVVLGAGLWRAAREGRSYTPWLQARSWSDLGDALALGLAWRAGARDPRLALTVLLALVATLLSWRARRAAPPAADG